MIKTRMAGTRAFLVALAVAGAASGSAAAAMPAFWLQLHARLAPVAGTTAAGRFDGALVRTGGGRTPQAQSAVPRAGSRWRLNWKLTLPALSGPMTASLRVSAARSAAPMARMLCTRCSTKASGTMTLTGSQAIRIAGKRAVVVVQTPTATLRGVIKGLAHVPVATRS